MVDMANLAVKIIAGIGIWLFATIIFTIILGILIVIGLPDAEPEVIPICLLLGGVFAIGPAVAITSSMK